MARKKQAFKTLKDAISPGEKIEPGPNMVSRKLAAYWKDQINTLDQAQSRWVKRGNDIIKRFRDERNRASEEGQRRMNLLWANIKILKPAVYGKPPVPIIERRFLDKDPVGRLSSMMLERTIRNEINLNDFHNALNRAVYDYLLPGRGIVWARYEPKIGNGPSLPVSEASNMEDELSKIMNDGHVEPDDSPEEDKLENTEERLLTESVPLDYIDWKDFYIFPPKARVWSEVQAIGKKVMMSKAECMERFGDEIGEDMKPDTEPMGSETERQAYSDTAVFQDINERNRAVFEIWCKTDMRVYWTSPGYEYLCDVKNDPLQLKSFFPVPEPLSATLTNDSMIPVPDYLEYQDQAIQIDELTTRIAMLAKVCKIAGTYDAANGPLKRLVQETLENQLIPVDSWAAYAEKGGVQGSVSFLPLKEIQECLNTLILVRQQAMQDLDMITGISDVIRGTTDSRETLGGIRLKNNNAGTRLTERQNEVARFARDVVGLIAEIVSKHFDDKTIIEASGIRYEEELQPENVKDEIRTKIKQKESESSQNQQPQQQAQPQQVQPNQGMAPQPQQQPGSNVVPFQPNGAAPQPPPQPPPMQDEEKEDPLDSAADIIIDAKIDAAIKLLRDDVRRNYRIDIEVDSTILGDAMQERQDASEFIQALTGFIQAAETIAQGMPYAVPLLGRLMQFGVRKFRTGRDLESCVDTFIAKAEQMVKDAENNPKPDPEEMKNQIQIQLAQLKLQSEEKRQQFEAQRNQQEQEAQRRNDIRDFQKQQAEDQREMQKMEMEMQFKREELQLKREELQMKHQITVQEAQMKMHQATQQHQLEVEHGHMEAQQQHVEHQQAMEQGEQQHKQAMEQGATAHSQKMQQGEQQHKQKVTHQKEVMAQKSKELKSRGPKK